VPQNERSRRTRAALLDATWQLLEELGPGGVTMSAVADRAGVSRRAVYLHFSSRGELLLALHAHVDERLDLAGSARRVFEAPDAVTAIEAFVALLAEFHPKFRKIDTALLAARDTDPDVAALIEQGTQIWLDGCRLISQRLEDEGRLAQPWTVETAADLMWHLMFPEILERLTEDRQWPIDQYRELLVVMLKRTLVTA
jgi:AcrR family transcriptional regulator